MTYRLSHEAVPSLAFPALSSSLSPVLMALESVEAEQLEQPASGASEYGEDAAYRATTSSFSSARPTPAAEGTGKDEMTTSFECPHCDKSYASEKSFKVSHTPERLMNCIDYHEASPG